MARDVFLSGKARVFDDDEIIVSKTDLKGRITYANDVFLRVAGMSEKQCLGEPHSLIRHPDMPRCVFKLLWDTLASGKEVFAYVINRAFNGDYYWVYAHVTPSFNDAGEIVGYHSNRRTPDMDIVNEHIIPLYKTLREEETRHKNRKDGMVASFQMVLDTLNGLGMEYDEYVCTLGQNSRRGYR